MAQIRKFLKLNQPERWLLLKCASLLGAIRVTLWLLPFSLARRLFNWASRRSPKLAASPVAIEQIAWGVEVVSGFVPGATHCLTKALAAQILLVRRGYPAQLYFGVLRQSKTHFIAHAWVESNGVVVVGGPDVEKNYVKLTSPTDQQFMSFFSQRSERTSPR